MRILHGADFHLDSPFSGLKGEEAQERRRLQRQLPMAMARLCRELKCDLVLLSGDVLDGSRPCPETVEALRQGLEACGCPVLIAPGNHDPYGPESPWAGPWSGNVAVFRGGLQRVELSRLGCQVWGGGFTESSCRDGLPQVRREPGRLELGVFHGHTTTPDGYRYLSPEQVAGSGFHYLALGHIHKTRLPQPAGGGVWVGWPGAAMGRGFDETGPKGFLEVEVAEDGCRGVLHPLPWPRYEDLTATMDRPAVLPPDCDQVYGRLTVTGEALPEQVRALFRSLEPKFRSLELRDRTTMPRETWGDGDGSLRSTALELLHRRLEACQGEEERQQVLLAARYLRAALEGGEPPCEF